jgi:hypothetical protein
VTDNPRHPDNATIFALSLWLAVGIVAFVLCGRAMAGAFDGPTGPAVPLLTTMLTMLASLTAWTLFHRDQSRGDLARRVLDGWIALAPVALIACATAVHASAGTLALLGGLLLCGIGYVVAHVAFRLPSRVAIDSTEKTAVRDSATARVDQHLTGEFVPENLTPLGPTADEVPPHEHFERRSLAGGGEQIEAVLIARFLPRQRQTAVHLPIHPVLPHAPHVECEPLDESAVELQVTAVYGYGVRVEVKRTTGLDTEAAIPVGLLVTTARSEISAA